MKFFSFAFLPCHKLLPYETAEVSVFTHENNLTEDVCQNGLEILKATVPVSQAHLVNLVNNNKVEVDRTRQAVITYQVINYFIT